MTRTEIEDEVKKSLKSVAGIDGGAINRESHLGNDIGLDSFASLELLFELEDKWKISISKDEARSLVTFGDVCHCIETKIRLGKDSAC